MTNHCRLAEIFGPYVPHFTVHMVQKLAEMLIASGALTTEHEAAARAVLDDYVPMAMKHPNGPIIGMRATMAELLR
ncbi:MAG: hypothetical protein JOY99_15175 [Sphingomonadaceae bacterium]|nr:hypothetical protein [Sphingomonadaceae bacterium]